MLIGVIHLSISIIVVTIHKPKQWYILHLIFATTGIELIIIGIVLLSGLILDIPHGIMGLIIVIILIGELFGGILARKTKEKKIRYTHIWISRIVYIATLIAVVLGILNFI